MPYPSHAVKKTTPSLFTSQDETKTRMQKPDSADAREDCVAEIRYLSVWCASGGQSSPQAMVREVLPAQLLKLPHQLLYRQLQLRLEMIKSLQGARW